MNKLLIAGGSHSDIPLLRAAKARGWYVVTSGNRPQDQGHAFGDRAELADFSDPEAILALARAEAVDAICASSNDFSQISSAYAAEALGLPGFDSYETTLLLHHKDRFRAFSAREGLPCPRASAFEQPELPPDALAGLSYPLIVKPIDLTGGKGVSKVEREADLAAAIDAAFAISRAKRIVIEEFFEGSLHSFSCFIQKGRVVFRHHDNEYSYTNPYLVSTSAGPSSVPEAILAQLETAIETMADRLRLVDGLLHAQFLWRDQDFRIIEFTRRCPGDFYAWPVQRASGLDYADAILRPLLGLPLGDLSAYTQSGFVSRHCVMAPEPGLIDGIEIAPEIQPFIDSQWLLQPAGNAIRDPRVDKERIVFLEYPDQARMLALTDRIHELIRLRLKPHAA